MKKALGYARVSGRTQATDGTGLDEQVAQVTEWATLNGYEIVEWFKDSITGELPWDKRPGVRALVERLAVNGVEAILVHQLDRIARGKAGIFEGFFGVFFARKFNQAVGHSGYGWLAPGVLGFALFNGLIHLTVGQGMEGFIGSFASGYAIAVIPAVTRNAWGSSLVQTLTNAVGRQ